MQIQGIEKRIFQGGVILPDYNHAVAAISDYVSSVRTRPSIAPTLTELASESSGYEFLPASALEAKGRLLAQRRLLTKLRQEILPVMKKELESKGVAKITDNHDDYITPYRGMQLILLPNGQVEFKIFQDKDAIDKIAEAYNCEVGLECAEVHINFQDSETVIYDFNLLLEILTQVKEIKSQTLEANRLAEENYFNSVVDRRVHWTFDLPLMEDLRADLLCHGSAIFYADKQQSEAGKLNGGKIELPARLHKFKDSYERFAIFLLSTQEGGNGNYEYVPPHLSIYGQPKKAAEELIDKIQVAAVEVTGADRQAKVFKCGVQV
ncbi:MAG: hypothetical protein HYY52_06805 [Candidatus Melainabacteria bacterium]|nr:hypothetical protein [Candidatus Melainabacteria bacterium]